MLLSFYKGMKDYSVKSDFCYPLEIVPSIPHMLQKTYSLLLILILWHKQAIFESKGDQLSSSAECRIRSWEVQDTKSQADWMPTHKPTELSRIKQNLNSTARPHDEWAFSPLDFTADWLSQLVELVC